MLVFANDHVHDQRFLRDLDREKASIIGALEPLVANELLGEPLLPATPTVEAIWDTFLKPRYEGRISVFHFGGHANDSALFIEDERGVPTSAHAPGLASFLGRQDGLMLVFLNGCSTRGQVERLRAEGVPAVIATSSAIDDQVASTFAAVFYKALRSKTLLESFELAKAAAQNKWGPVPDALLRDGFRDARLQRDPVADEQGWPWTLSCAPETETWTLAPLNDETPTAQESTPSEATPATRPAVLAGRELPWALAGVVALVAVFTAGYLSLIGDPPTPDTGETALPRKDRGGLPGSSTEVAPDVRTKAPSNSGDSESDGRSAHQTVSTSGPSVPPPLPIELSITASIESKRGDDWVALDASRDPRVRNDDQVQLKISPNADAYVYVFLHSTGDDQLTVLHPRRDAEHELTPGGTTLSLPGPELFFKVLGLPGTERFIVAASREREDALDRIVTQAYEGAEATKKKPGRLFLKLRAMGYQSVAPSRLRRRSVRGSTTFVEQLTARLRERTDLWTTWELEHVE